MKIPFEKIIPKLGLCPACGKFQLLNTDETSEFRLNTHCNKSTTCNNSQGDPEFVISPKCEIPISLPDAILILVSNRPALFCESGTHMQGLIVELRCGAVLKIRYDGATLYGFDSNLLDITKLFKHLNIDPIPFSKYLYGFEIAEGCKLLDSRSDMWIVDSTDSLRKLGRWVAGETTPLDVGHRYLVTSLELINMVRICKDLRYPYLTTADICLSQFRYTAAGRARIRDRVDL